MLAFADNVTSSSLLHEGPLTNLFQLIMAGIAYSTCQAVSYMFACAAVSAQSLRAAALGGSCYDR